MFIALRSLVSRLFRSHSNTNRPPIVEDSTEADNTHLTSDWGGSGAYTKRHSPVAPYHESLLERSRTQWQFGDWASLAKLTPATLQDHPDRAKLALLAAAGCLQLGLDSNAKQLLRSAKDWGCSKKLMSQVLIAGVHNSLGRAAAVASNDERALLHFEGAIRLVAPATDVPLMGHARTVKEMTDLGLLPQATAKIEQLQRQIRAPHTLTSHAAAHAKVLDMEVDMLRGRVYSLQKQFDQTKMVNPIIGRAAEPEAASSGTSKLQPVDNGNKKYYGLNSLDKKLESYLDYDNGYFVELGANDGVNQSNTYFFEKQRGWRGVLIEPILHNFLKCKVNRSPQNAIVCAACVPFSHSEPHVKLIYSNLMTVPVGLESDILDPEVHAKSGEVYLPKGEVPVEIMATAKTLATILDEAKAPQLIDLLTLDVEGAEIAVLKGLDHLRYRFKYMLIESREEDKLDAFLTQHGYARIDKLSNHDYLYANANSHTK